MLPRALVNRIAAGEIVERPASVVKELVENSLDAGARRIGIRIVGGGVERIVVTDDGSGIDPRDMLLSVQAHATSKLATEEDLWSIPTFGFRGEALASIASISRLEIRSRIPGALEGARLVSEGDRTEGITPWTGPEGTSVTVSDLFFNTPVRHRQLGAPATEAAHVTARVRELALGNPGVSFRLTSGEREVLFTSGAGDLAGTVAEVFDADLAGRLLPVGSGENPIVGGLVGPPDLSRARRDRQFFLLNGRAITHPALQAVLDRAYEGFAPANRYPVAIILLNVRPDRVDVNVHPTKRRVRFHDERELAGRLYRGVQAALLSMNVPRWELPEDTGHRLVFRESPVAEGSSSAGDQLGYGARDGTAPMLRVEDTFDRLEPLGQVANAYIAARGPGGLYLVDQHAACERLYYEEALRHAGGEDEDVPVQRLVAPVVIELDAEGLSRWKTWGHLLAELGFEVEEFGPESLVVRAVPLLAGDPVSAHTLVEVLSRVGEGTSTAPTPVRAAAALAACRASVKAGDAMTSAEMRGLFARMARLRSPGVCPHGRPTVIHVTRREIDKLFRRA